MHFGLRVGIVGVVVAALVLGGTAAAAAKPAAADKPSQALLQKAKTLEAFLTGQYKFNDPLPDGKTVVDFETFAHLGMGNVSTERMVDKKAPVWTGRQFAAGTSLKDASGQVTAVSFKGSMSADFAAIETMVVGKTVTEKDGRIISARWTFKDLPGQAFRNAITRKTTVVYGGIYPVEQIPAHLSDVGFSQARTGRGPLTFAGIPTAAEIEAKFKGNTYLDSYKRVQFSVTFSIE
jgi:hypothetical protein